MYLLALIGVKFNDIIWKMYEIITKINWKHLFLSIWQ